MFEPEAVALEKLLRQYQELADNGGWPEWQIGKKLSPRQQDARIPVLRQLLTITGDYKHASATPASLRRYDDALVAAVKYFQARHGLTPDGTLGKGTQNALAVPVEERILQIKATIARMRAGGLAQEPRFVLVNLPAFTLYAVEDGKTMLTMPVIVGDRKNHTPLFDNAITSVLFNPPWHVPERIARNELIPKLKTDPHYFIRAGFEVTQNGQPVDPAHLPEGEDFTFRQRSGDENALGKIKFNVDDPYNIYLHSTPSPRLFAKDDRALSHGCIRVGAPDALAHFVLKGTKGWQDERIDAAYSGSKVHWVSVEPVPVHLVYWTAFVDANGTAHFFGDMYNLNDRTGTPKKPVTLAAQ